VLQSLLYEMPAHDPASFLAAPLVVLATALLATVLPARQAARVSPMVALRTE
jgi:ABC-type lipoprotein release transport system permease subunit